jgi:hypothetical protein
MQDRCQRYGLTHCGKLRSKASQVVARCFSLVNYTLERKVSLEPIAITERSSQQDVNERRIETQRLIEEQAYQGKTSKPIDALRRDWSSTAPRSVA